MKGFIEFKESKGGAKAGKLELIKINLDKAKAFAEDIFKKNNRDLEEELPDFDDNFIKAQRIAGGGFAQRKDMPVISNNDVKNLQRTLKKGEIDITKPFSSPVVATPPAFAAFPGPKRILFSKNTFTASGFDGIFAPSEIVLHPF